MTKMTPNIFLGTPIERITNKIKKCTDTGCWNWLGTKTIRGYGQLIIDGQKLYAHRVSYALFHGELPRTLNVCHKCDNVQCVNPDHLFLGTQKDNLQDMSAKGRSTRGERNPQAKLTADVIKEIRDNATPNEQLAKQYGVSRRTISAIKKKERWSHVQ